MLAASTATSHGVLRCMATETAWQKPPTHAPPWQSWPHAPQLAASLHRFALAPPQVALIAHARSGCDVGARSAQLPHPAMSTGAHAAPQPARSGIADIARSQP